MVSHAQKKLTTQEILIFRKIKTVVEKIPDIDLGHEHDGEPIMLSCHMLVRAVQPFFSTHVNICDGYYSESYRHSWLTTEGGHVIDVYPVATLSGPMLVVAKTSTPAGRSYKPGLQESHKQDFSKPTFRRAVWLLKKEVRAIVKSLPQ